MRQPLWICQWGCTLQKNRNFAREKNEKNDDLSVESVGCHIFAPTFQAPEAPEASL